MSRRTVGNVAINGIKGKESSLVVGRSLRSLDSQMESRIFDRKTQRWHSWGGGVKSHLEPTV